MKYALILATAAYFAFTAPFFGQGSASSGKPARDKQGPIDILSDTKGFDMTTYLNHVVEKVRLKWFEQIPEVARPPVARRGKVSIRFRVMKDGQVNDVKYEENSGDKTLDRAAYAAVTASNPLRPLPGGFACQYVDLRFNFYYNPRLGDLTKKNSRAEVLPCVTSKIQFIGERVVTVSPSSVRIAIGAKQQFHAVVDGTVNVGVIWSVEGPGCDGSACGVISADGLYTAPAHVPNPATISVTATVTTAPSQRAVSSVIIVPPSDSR